MAQPALKWIVEQHGRLQPATPSLKYLGIRLFDAPLRCGSVLCVVLTRQSEARLHQALVNQ